VRLDFFFFFLLLKGRGVEVNVFSPPSFDMWKRVSFNFLNFNMLGGVGRGFFF